MLTTSSNLLKSQIISPGFAVGPAVIFTPRLKNEGGEHLNIEEKKNALKQAAEDIIERLHTLLQVAGSDEANDLFFEAGLLEPEGLLGLINHRLEIGLPLREAINEVFSQAAQDALATSDETYVKSARLIGSAKRRVIEHLFSNADNFEMPPAPAIIVARDITPSELTGFVWEKGHGLILENCAPHGHLAGIIRDLGIPTVSNVDIAMLATAKTLSLDAQAGLIAVDPESEQVAQMATAAREAMKLERIEDEIRTKPALLASGETVEIYLSLNDLSSLEHADPNAFDGVGLVRTEFLFQNKSLIENEEIQISVYDQILSWAGEKPVAIRLFDAAPDKIVKGVTDEFDSAVLSELGLRGVRFLLHQKTILRSQLRALLQSAQDRQLTAIVPMVTVPDEIDAVVQMRDQEAESLGVDPNRVTIGMMAEVPASLCALDLFGATAFAIGLNDLTQYMTAAGRTIQEVSTIADPCHPGVLQLVAQAMETARKEKKPLWVCGSSVVEERVLRALIDAGVRRMSVPPNSVGFVKRLISEHK